jgi:hypothetical protein
MPLVSRSGLRAFLRILRRPRPDDMRRLETRLLDEIRNSESRIQGRLDAIDRRFADVDRRLVAMDKRFYTVVFAVSLSKFGQNQRKLTFSRRALRSLPSPSKELSSTCPCGRPCRMAASTAKEIWSHDSFDSGC